MMNPLDGPALIDTSLITIYAPTTRQPSFVGLELVVLGLAALGLVHAVRAHRRGDPAALVTWLTIFVYGLVMEIVSYNAFDNFGHGQFTIGFYDRQLPLYIMAVYPVLLYTGITTARHLGLPRLVEPLAAGLLIVAMDAPFDVVGPVAGWWRWYDNDPNLAYRWLGVPVTSYYWHFTFGAVVAALTAWVAARAQRKHQRAPSPWLSLPLSVAVIAVGMVFFVPFHLLKAVGVSDGTIVAATLIGSAALVAVTPRAARGARDRWLPVPWLVFYGYHAVVAATLASDGGGWGRRAAFVGTVAASALVVRYAGALRRPALTKPAV